MTTPETPAPIPRIRRRFRYLAIVSVVGFAGWWFRAPILQCLPWLVMVDAPLSSVDQLVILDGADAYDFAARQIAEGEAREILIYNRFTNRLVRRGLLPNSLECARLASQEAAIPPSKIQEIDREVSGVSEILKELVTRLESDSTLRIGLVCDAWRSRWLSGKVSSVVPRQLRRRVVLLPLSDPQIKLDRWWAKKVGQRRFAEELLRITVDWLVVDSDQPRFEQPRSALKKAAIAGF